MLRIFKATRARTLLSNAISDWVNSIAILATSTQDYYRAVISDFAKTVPDVAVEKLTIGTIRAYLSTIVLKGKKSTANKYLRVIKSFCRFLEENYGIDNPTRYLRQFKLNPSVRHFLTKEEYLKLLSACKTKREHDIITLLANTGLRASELCSLTWDSVEPQLTRITVVGKGSKMRIVPLNESCRKVLSTYPRGTRLYFSKNRHSLYQTCRAIGDRANIPLNPHSLRHYFATMLLQSGVRGGIKTVSLLLGHASVELTEKTYIHYTGDFLDCVTDCLDS